MAVQESYRINIVTRAYITRFIMVWICHGNVRFRNVRCVCVNIFYVWSRGLIILIVTSCEKNGNLTHSLVISYWVKGYSSSNIPSIYVILVWRRHLSSKTTHAVAHNGDLDTPVNVICKSCVLESPFYGPNLVIWSFTKVYFSTWVSNNDVTCRCNCFKIPSSV
jgi:hypothetical protein